MPPLSRRAFTGAALTLPAAAALPAVLPSPAHAARAPFPQIGATVRGTLFNSLNWPRVDVTRVFFGRNLGTWRSSLLDHLNPGGTLWLSYHDDSASNAGNFFRSIPDSVLANYRVMATYYHEPENEIDNNTTAKANYRARWRDHSQAMRAGGAIPTLILMRYTLQRFSGRNWRDYYPGDEYIDINGWDCYRKGAAGDNGMDVMENMAAPIEAVARETGNRWAIGETGSTKFRYSNADSATWAANWRRYILNSPTSAVGCWWDQNEFTFTSQTANAWLG